MDPFSLGFIVLLLAGFAANRYLPQEVTLDVLKPFRGSSGKVTARSAGAAVKKGTEKVATRTGLVRPSPTAPAPKSSPPPSGAAPNRDTIVSPGKGTKMPRQAPPVSETNTGPVNGSSPGPSRVSSPDSSRPHATGRAGSSRPPTSQGPSPRNTPRNKRRGWLTKTAKKLAPSRSVSFTGPGQQGGKVPTVWSPREEHYTTTHNTTITQNTFTVTDPRTTVPAGAGRHRAGEPDMTVTTPTTAETVYQHVSNGLDIATMAEGITEQIGLALTALTDHAEAAAAVGINGAPLAAWQDVASSLSAGLDSITGAVDQARNAASLEDDSLRPLIEHSASAPVEDRVTVGDTRPE